VTKAGRWKTIRNATQSEGLDFDFGSYGSYVHVPLQIMKQLDEVYLKHFRGDGGLTLANCFNLHEDENHVDLFLSYLDAVGLVLACFLKLKDLQPPLLFGLKGACARLMPLFHPLEGRINLPLTTVSMLQDLKDCLLTEANVICEVCEFEDGDLVETDASLQVSRWFDGLSSHMMAARSHEMSAQVWSDVIANKLSRMCPLDNSGDQRADLTCTVGTTFLPHPTLDVLTELQVFNTFLSHARNFGIISGEIINCIPPKGKQEIATRAKSSEVEKLFKKKIFEAGSFNIPRSENKSPFWSLLAGTAWTLQKPSNDQVKNILAVALEESKGPVLDARSNSLSLGRTMELRFDLWLNTNLWLRWNQTTLFGAVKPFIYWDLCKDEVEGGREVYGKETREAIGKVIVRDMGFLKDLGDMLTTHPALTNNRDAPKNQRVICVEAKEKIDELLKAS
jgi:hypothetical protein